MFEFKYGKKFFFLSSIMGILSGFILFIVKKNNPAKTNLRIIRLNRYLLVIFALFLLLLFLSSVILSLKRDKTGKSKSFLIQNIFNLLTLYFGLFYSMRQIFDLTGDFIYFGENTISTQALFRMTGFSLGILISALLFFSIYSISVRMSKRRFFVFLNVSLFINTVFALCRGISSLNRMNLLPINKFVFEIMIFEDKYKRHFTYATLFVAVIFAGIMFFESLKIKGNFQNNAIRRKEKARFKKNRRWAYSILCSSAFIIFTLTYLNYYDTKEVPLTPPGEYEDAGDLILIPLDKVNDGHLHRFSYKTSDGIDVRFIVVKKSQGNAYGLGLDACEICGIAGYYERGNEVICKRCDVVMNKATIGFHGGCNPIPFPYEIKNAKIIIEKKTLEAEKKRFR